MKKTFSMIAVLASFFFLARGINPASEIVFGQEDTLLNPNGMSELAILMRDMQKYTNDAKAAIKAGKPPLAYPVSFDKIYTAKISDGMHKSDFYKSFADLYIMSVKNYNNSKPEQLIETYNNMVSACLACHSQHCPGPVPVIKKMTWSVQ